MKASTSYLLMGGCLLLALCALACGGPSKLQRLETRRLGAALTLPQESDIPELAYRQTRSDTIVVQDAQGNEMILMKAIRDSETGEMVANEQLTAAVVTARFRNLAERRGKVDLRFQLRVPAELQDRKWQLRFYPDMFILGDSTRLESVIVTGEQYRQAQLKGYEQYEKFLSKIIQDSSYFVDLHQLEVFLQRNIPQVFAFKSDSSEVSEEHFYASFGVSEQDALRHFTNQFARRRNARRIADKGKMFSKYVKSPILHEGIRLDTVIQDVNGDLLYNYTQTIQTRPKLRKVEIILSGDVYEQDRRIYRMPRSEPLTFYISSLASFADMSARFQTRIIERKVQANASYKIEFAQGGSDILLDFGDNDAQVQFVKDNLADLLRNEVFDLDSIEVVANASPEGRYALNAALSRQRGEAVVRYFESFIRDWRRRQEEGFSVGEDGRIQAAEALPDLQLRSRCEAENWPLLDRLVERDPRLTPGEKEQYRSHLPVQDKDRREMAMRQDPYYPFVRDSLYPMLRVVDFRFHLHRKGMVKDTVHTTELDQRYMEGVQLLRNMDYEKAVTILGPYQDYNTALAYMGCERNASAMLILKKMTQRTAPVLYLMAILYSRTGNEKEAVQAYLDACRQDPSYVHRGNLDPEISALIKLYGLNREKEEDE